MNSRIQSAAVFLDRDGVINEEVNWLHRVDQLRLIPGSAGAIRRLNENHVLAIVVTNQSVIGQGLCTEEELQAIHGALRKMLEEGGAHLDAIYYCPHHEDAAVENYRRACPDRKPNIGMLLKAAEDFQLDLRRCFLVGDKTTDILTARNAGSQSILVKSGYGGSDGTRQATPDFVCSDLAEAVEVVIRRFQESRIAGG